MEEYRTLILRSARSLGSSLLRLRLINEEQLEQANQRFLEIVKGGNLKQACLLKILINEQGALNLRDLLNASNFQLIALEAFNIAEPVSEYNVDTNACYATWTVIFDQVEDFYFLATAYNLSEPVIDYWEKKLDGRILWHTTSIGDIDYALEEISAKRHTV